MSGEYAALLKRRAMDMLELASTLLASGKHDLAALHAEYAAQLYLKSVLLRLSGEEYRGHGIRVLLGALAALLEEQGCRDEAAGVIDYVRANRRLLAELEEAHVRAVYGALEYSRSQAEKLLQAARGVVGLLRRIEARLLDGGGEA